MPRPDGHPVVAAVLDLAMASFAPIRRELLAHATGDVLEIGVGTGMNLPLYPPGVRRVVGVEPDPYMRRRAARRVQEAQVPVELLDASAEHLPLPDASFDTVVGTWVLCTIPDPDAAARELRRVIRPGGRLLFAEHTASRYPVPRRLQRALTPCWRRVAGGCHLDRDGLGILRRAGFTLDVVPNPRDRFTLGPVYWGTGAPA